MIKFNIKSPWWRTLVTNIITASVALGLELNRRRNREIPARAWSPKAEAGAPLVEIVAPMRNEGANVAPLLASLLAQEYPNKRWRVTVIDDASTDGTRQLAEQIARSHPQLRVVQARPLPKGWTGKCNAMYSGYLTSSEEADWLLFLDADTRHTPLMLASLVTAAQQANADMLSIVIDVRMESFWERVLVPQVGELYTLLVGTMDQVNQQGSKGAAANGQCLLIRREIFGQLGSLPTVRGDVAEDRALAQALKERGYNVRLEYGRNLVYARVYSSLRDMWNGYAKTLFWASGHNTRKAIAVLVALTLYGIAPPVAAAVTLARRPAERTSTLAHASLQLLPMLLLRAVICRKLGVPAYYSLTYPLGVVTGNLLLLYSMYRVLSGKGVQWKGRIYT